MRKNNSILRRVRLLTFVLIILALLFGAPIMLLKSADRHDRGCEDLTEAAGMGEVEIVRQSVRTGVDVNCVTDLGGTTPLNEAANNHLHGAEEVQILLAAGAKVNELDIEGHSPLDHAATHEVAKLLAMHGARRTDSSSR